MWKKKKVLLPNSFLIARKMTDFILLFRSRRVTCFLVQVAKGEAMTFDQDYENKVQEARLPSLLSLAHPS
jgi:hypothetical protein